MKPRSQKIRGWLGTVACVLAVGLLLWVAIDSYEPPRVDQYTSVHAPSTVAPLMTLAEDSVINTGDVAALDALPGIGEVLAQRIIDFRSEYGRIYLPEELLHVNGIGEKRVEGIVNALDEEWVPMMRIPAR